MVLLRNSSSEVKLKRKTHLDIINCIITVILLRTPKRAGILGQALFEDYEQNRATSDQFYLRIKYLKTSNHSGSAHIPLFQLRTQNFNF